MTKPPKAVRSDGYGSDYIVLDAVTKIPVTDVCILFVEYYRELIPVLRELGFNKWADDQKRKWADIDREKENE